MRKLTSRERAILARPVRRGRPVEHTECSYCHKKEHHARGLCEQCYYRLIKRTQREPDSDEFEIEGESE